MPDVVFYILSASVTSATAVSARWHIAYRLCKKAMQKSAVTFLVDASETSALSDLLWTHETESFIAHQVQQTDNQDGYILITHQLQPNHPYDVIINLTHKAVIHPQVNRIVEIVAHDEASKAMGRENYKAYRTAGFALTNHQI